MARIPQFSKLIPCLVISLILLTGVTKPVMSGQPIPISRDALDHLQERIEYYRYRDPSVAIENALEALELALSLSNDKAAADIYMSMGDIYSDLGLYDKSLDAYSNALVILSHKGKETLQASCLNSIGRVFSELGLYRLAHERFEQASALFEKQGEITGLSNSLNLTGMNHGLSGDHDQALQYFNEVLDLPADSLDAGIRANTYTNIGTVFAMRGDLQLSLEFLRRALEIRVRLDDGLAMAQLNNKLGNVYRQMDDHVAAMARYEKAAGILDSLGFPVKLAGTRLLQAKILSIAGDPDRALALVNHSMSVAYDHDCRSLLADSYLLLAEIYRVMDDIHSSHAYFRQYAAMKDSLMNSSTVEAISRAETRTELLKRGISFDQQGKGKLNEKYVRWFVIIILILSSLSVILAISKLFSQRKANRVLEHQRNILKDTLLGHRISEEKYKALFSQANDAIFMMDHETFLECNDKTLEIFKCQREEIVGHPPYNFSPPTQPDGKDSKEKALQLINACIEGRPQRFYWVHNRKDGTLFDAEVSLNTIELGEKTYIQAIVRDISERVRTERAMVEAREKAEKATESKTFFLAKMSHEIRTMLGGITSSAELLMSTKVDKQQRELLEIINSSADNLLGIVNEILDLSKIEAGKISLEENLFNLHKTIETNINACLQKAKDKGIALFLAIHHDLPEYVRGDELRLSQILANLLSNAIKFTNEGSVTLDVILAKEKSKSLVVEFKVIDTGIGIPSNRIRDLFTEYSQSDLSISRRFGGTGLGLNIVYRLVTLMKGTIEAESEVNKGSCFKVRIPFRKSERPVEAGKDEGAAITSGSSKYRILLAEDNVINQKITMINLRNLGHIVDLAVNGSEAWKFYNENEYDIILMDIQMPEMDGIEVTRLIRKHEEEHPGRARTRIIALTANILGQDAEYCLSEGMDAYISKPFSIEDVIAKLEP